MKNSDEREVKRYKIYVLGNQSAGKSCLLAGLEILSELNRPSGVSVTALHTSKNVLTALAESIRDGVFPSSTTSIATLETEIRDAQTHLSCNWIDYPGERFMTSYGRGEGVFAQEVANVLDGDFFLVALSPEDYLPHEGVALQNEGDLQARADRTIAIRSALEHIRRERRSGHTHVAILLTKADLFTGDPMNPSQAESFLESRAPAVLKNIRGIFSDVSVFAISAVGNCVQTDNLPPQPDKMNLNPWGYEHLYAWMIKQVRREKRAPTIRRSIFASAFAIVAVLSTTLWFYFQQQQANRKLDDLVRGGLRTEESSDFLIAFKGAASGKKNSTVDAIIQRAEQITSSTSLADMTAVRDELLQVIKVSHGYRLQEANTLRNELASKIESNRYGAIERSFKTDSKESIQIAQSFLADFPSSNFRDEVQALLNQNAASEQQKAHTNLKNLAVDSPQALRQFAIELEEYIQKYDTPNKNDAVEAVRLTRRLASDLESPKPMKVELTSLGALTTPGYLELRIFRGDSREPIYKRQSSEKVESYGFDTNKEFNLSWSAGDEITIEVWLDWGLIFREKKLASECLKGLRDLAKLDSPIRMKALEAVSYLKDGEVVLETDLKQWEDSDWKLLNDWVFGKVALDESLKGAG